MQDGERLCRGDTEFPMVVPRVENCSNSSGWPLRVAEIDRCYATRGGGKPYGTANRDRDCAMTAVKVPRLERRRQSRKLRRVWLCGKRLVRRDGIQAPPSQYWNQSLPPPLVMVWKRAIVSNAIYPMSLILPKGRASPARTFDYDTQAANSEKVPGRHWLSHSVRKAIR